MGKRFRFATDVQVSTLSLELSRDAFEALRDAAMRCGIHKEFPIFETFWGIDENTPDFYCSMSVVSGTWLPEDEHDSGQLPELIKVDYYRDNDVD